MPGPLDLRHRMLLVSTEPIPAGGLARARARARVRVRARARVMVMVGVRAMIGLGLGLGAPVAARKVKVFRPVARLHLLRDQDCG